VAAPLARWCERAPAGWDALVAADPAASPAHRPALWQALADAHPAYEARLVVIEERGVLVGGAPVMLERRGPFTWLHALPRMLPGAALARDGRQLEVEREVARAIAELARERRVIGGSWAVYRPIGPPPEAGSLALVPGETRWIETALVELGEGLEAAFARMDRKQRQAVRHARTQGLEFSDDPARLEAAYALHVRQALGWGGHRRMPLELSRRLLESGSGEPVARLFSLADARGTVSAALALDGPHETFVWWSGTHAEGRSRGVFALLLWRIAGWAAARGRRRVNLGASTGLEQVQFLKASMGATSFRYPLRWLDARHAGFAGRTVASLQARMRRGRPLGEAASS
jgi:hypothetical protein